MSAEFASHAGYIVASYVAAIAILGLLVGQTILRYRSAKARLGDAGDERG